MKRILIHIVGLTQLVASVLLIIKWLSKPTNIGQLGADNIVFNILLTIIVTVVSFIIYLVEQNGIEKLVPVIIASLTVWIILIGAPIKEKIEENNKPLMTVDLGDCSMKLFENNDYEILFQSTEFRHFDRGTYQRTADKIMLDREVGGFTNFFFINDTTLYVIEYSTLDTVVFKINR